MNVAAPTRPSPIGLVASRIFALARSSSGCIEINDNQTGNASAARTSGAGRRPSALDRFTGQIQRGILTAEAEGVRHHGRDARVASLVGDHIEGNGRIGNVVVDGRRNSLMLERQER